MAQVNILNLPVRIALTGTEYVPGQAVGGTTQRFTTAQIAALATATEFGDAVIVRTITAMKALNPNDRSLCFLDDQGRSGTFFFIADNFTTQVSADSSNGIYVAPNIDPTGASGAWVRNYSGGANVLWFGAVGDDSTDDTLAIQAAVTTVLGGSPTTPGSVYFPQGTYKITAAISIPFSTGWRIFGECRLGVTLKQYTDNTQIFKLTADLTHSWTISSLNFDYHAQQAVSNTSAIPIHMKGTGSGDSFFNFGVLDCNFANCYYGIAGNSGNGVTCWGAKYSRLNFAGTITGGAILLQQGSPSGQPNNSFDQFYVTATAMTLKVFDLATCENTQMDNIEINDLTAGGLALRLTSGTLVCGSFKVEGYSVSTNGARIFEITDSSAQFGRLELGGSTNTINPGGGNAVNVIGAANGNAVFIDIDVLDLVATVSSGTLNVFNVGSSSLARFHYLGQATLPTGCVLCDIPSTAAAESVKIPEWDQLNMGADTGDADLTVVPGTTRSVIRYETTLTANRTIALPNTSSGVSNLFTGLRYIVVRSGLGNFRLDTTWGGNNSATVSFPPNTGGIMEFMYFRFGWKLIRKWLDSSVSSDNGDAGVTLTVGQASFTQRWATALTTPRTVTLSTAGAINGDKWVIVRTAAATGASVLNVGTGPLIALAAAQWAQVQFDGSAWFLAESGPIGTLNLAVGTTTISGGATTRILYDNAGVLGEYTITGSGTVVAMQNTPTLTTPVIGAATGTSLVTTNQIWSGSVSAALSTLTGATDGFRSSELNATALASESTTASSATSGALVGMYCNDGAAMASGDRLGGIRMGGSSSGSALRNSTLIAGFADQNWVDGSAYGSRLEFQTTTNTSTSATTKAIISNAGVFALGATLANTVPALKPSSAILQARLADDSAYAAFEALTFNKVTITAPASASTLTIADGKTLTVSNTLTLAGTDSTTMTFPSVSASIPGLAVANTFTTTQTITPGTEVSPLVLTGGTLAGTTSRPLISATQTWNNSGLTATGILANVTDTSSNSASLLMDLQVGGASKFNVRKDGNVTGASGINASGAMAASHFTDGASGQFDLGAAGSGGPGLRLGSGLVASWSSTSGLGTLDTGLSRISAGVLGVGNGTIADVTGTLSCATVIASTAIRINVAPTAVGTGTKTISNAADGSTNFGHYAAINLNGTVYYFPCSAVAPT